MTESTIMNEAEFAAKQRRAKKLAIFRTPLLLLVSLVTAVVSGVVIFFTMPEPNSGFVVAFIVAVMWLVPGYLGFYDNKKVELEKTRRNMATIATPSGSGFTFRPEDQFGFDEPRGNAIAFDRESKAMVLRIGDREPKIVEPGYIRNWQEEWLEVINKRDVSEKKNSVILTLDDVDFPKVRIAASGPVERGRIAGLLEIFVNPS